MPKGKKVKVKATKVQELAEETLSNTESASSAESGRTVLKRNDFICGTGHNQHLQEDFVEDKGLLVGRKLHHQRHRPTNQESSQSSPSSPDSRSLRSTPGVDQQLDTVSEEPKDQSEILKKCHSEGQHTLKSKWGFRSFQGLFSKSVEDSRESPDPETNNPGTTTKPEFVLGDCGTQTGTRTPVSNGNLPKWSHARSYSYVGTEETESRPRRGPLNRQDSFSRPLRLQGTRSLSESESEGKINGKVFSRQSLTHTRQAVSADAVQDFMYVKRESVIHPPQTVPPQDPKQEPEMYCNPRVVNGRFENPWPTWRKPTFGNVIKWSLTARDNSGIPSAEELDKALPIVPLNPKILNVLPSDGVRVTWLGHASVLVQFDGISILTDPMFSARASPTQYLGPKRYRDPPGTVHDLPKIDAVVISHTHYDHLDYGTVQLLNGRFGEGLHWFVPLNLQAWMREAGCENVTELTWWQEGSIVEKEQFSFVFTPAQHWCKRTPNDDNKVLWGSWCVLGPRHRFFFTGDTGYCEVFKRIGERYGPFDLAAVPIGAYDPRWFMSPQHIDPSEAVMIHQDVNADRSVAIHWGTFPLANEHYLEPPKKLEEALQSANIEADRFFVLKHGESKLILRGS